MRFPGSMKKVFMCELSRQGEGPSSQELLMQSKEGAAGHTKTQVETALHYLTCKVMDSVSYSITAIFKTGFEVQMASKSHVRLFNPVEHVISSSH